MGAPFRRLHIDLMLLEALEDYLYEKARGGDMAQAGWALARVVEEVLSPPGRAPLRYDFLLRKFSWREIREYERQRQSQDSAEETDREC